MTEDENNHSSITPDGSGTYGKIGRFVLNCLGSVPVAGGPLTAIAGAWSEADQDKINKIFEAWMKLQEEKIAKMGQTLAEVMMRVDLNNEETERRVKSPEYSDLLKKCLNDMSASYSEEKRKFVRNLLANAAETKICSDNVIKMFIRWVEIYDEAHFAVLRYIYKNDNCTRREIWFDVYGETVREDSSEADLFKMLIDDLTLGHLIRQKRMKDANGNFLKAQPARRRSPGRSQQYLKSAFDDEKGYELTELARQFIHYTMNEIVPKISFSE